MVAHFLTADRVFFEEWSRLRGVSKRSIARAAQLARALELDLDAIPSLVVVGSKGKATAATYASAALAAGGKRVGTITSPPILSNRERIRIDGVAIDEATYETIAARIAQAAARLEPATNGYLSPAGMYMLAGLDHFRREGCDAFVVEAGMGGRSDEVSLLDPRVLAATPIFGEHLGILGDTIEEIAIEKLSIARPHTRVVSAPQSAVVEQVFANLGIEPVIANAVGIEAARAYGEAIDEEALRRVLATVHLPGRLTTAIDEHGRRWMVDAAINADAIEAAVRHAGDVDFVLVSLPDNKDVARTAAWLDRELGADRWVPVIPPDAQHLPYSNEAWQRPLVPWNDIRIKGRNIVAVGSWSFMSAVLARLGVDCERAFDASGGGAEEA